MWDPRSSVTSSPSAVAPVSVRCGARLRPLYASPIDTTLLSSPTRASQNPQRPSLAPADLESRAPVGRRRHYSKAYARTRRPVHTGCTPKAPADLGASAWALLRLVPGRARWWRPARAAGASLLLWSVPISSLLSSLCCGPFRLPIPPCDAVHRISNSDKSATCRPSQRTPYP
jgi:hypothetical protein